jgi:hypothetical protein
MFRTLTNPTSFRNSLKLAGVAVVAAVGAGLIVGLPAFSSNSASDASVRATAGVANAADAAACDRHSWPYLDQRCVDPAATAKDLRQVRVISLDRIAPTTIVTTAAPVARIAPQNSNPTATLAAPEASQNALLQPAWAANPMQLVLLPQGTAAKEPVRKATSQAKMQSQPARIAMAVQVRH